LRFDGGRREVGSGGHGAGGWGKFSSVGRPALCPDPKLAAVVAWAD
jgi:hypothetical protein